MQNLRDTLGSLTVACRRCVGGLLLVLAALQAVPAWAAESNLRLHGTLVADPCVIPPGEDEVQLDFGNLVGKYLYLNTRTPGQSFSLHLTGCDLSLGTLVSVSFSGTESLSLPGLLALDAGSGVKGIAIGLETPTAVQLPLNKAGGKTPLRVGENTIVLKAYVEAEPEAIRTQSIAPGAFTATATFNLEYE